MATLNGKQILAKGWAQLQTGDSYVDRLGGTSLTIEIDETGNVPEIVPVLTSGLVTLKIKGLLVGTSGPADGTYSDGINNYAYNVVVARLADLGGRGFYTIQYMFFSR